MDSYNTTTFNFPNAIVRVHRPELTDQERSKRMKAIHKASADLLKEVEKRKTERN
ncbi:MAG: hypothetical protein IKU08_09095 [Clostridia bacterium]|nr:hypothetical protein [Clostridia bacterium]